MSTARHARAPSETPTSVGAALWHSLLWTRLFAVLALGTLASKATGGEGEANLSCKDSGKYISSSTLQVPNDDEYTSVLQISVSVAQTRGRPSAVDEQVGLLAAKSTIPVRDDTTRTVLIDTVVAADAHPSLQAAQRTYVPATPVTSLVAVGKHLITKIALSLTNSRRTANSTKGDDEHANEGAETFDHELQQAFNHGQMVRRINRQLLSCRDACKKLEKRILNATKHAKKHAKKYAEKLQSCREACKEHAKRAEYAEMHPAKKKVANRTKTSPEQERAKELSGHNSREKVHGQLHWQTFLLVLPLVIGVAVCVPFVMLNSSPNTPELQRSESSQATALAPPTHRLPYFVMWGVTILTAVVMALINFATIWIISFVVQWKFVSMQDYLNWYGVMVGALVLVGIATGLATLCTAVIFLFDPAVGNSGAPENKGWLNGNPLTGSLKDLFTLRHLIVRAMGTVLANTAGYPVGREGPTVTMGSNVAYLITRCMAMPYVTQSIRVDERLTALIIDEERLAHAKRIVCITGGACGMAMLFDSPIGGIIYMFEEITAAAWPLEVTLRAFAGTTVASLISRALLNLCGTDVKAFVIYEWDPTPQPWTWNDVPFFVLLALVLGPFSAFHTNACLKVYDLRQRLHKAFKSWQPRVKIFDAVFYAALCASTYCFVSCMARCFAAPDGGDVQSVRFNCQEGQYNPVASMLLTTSEGALKVLFSRNNFNELLLQDELLAFVTYTTFNIGLTGVCVPSGNFTGSMLVGALAGRVMGALVQLHTFHLGSNAPSGVYAMVGSAAMLAGFKQMSVAVVVFIVAAANDLDLIPPLMLTVVISLLLNRLINDKGFDEEQMLRKGVPFLPAEPPDDMEEVTAAELCDPRTVPKRVSDPSSEGILPEESILPEDYGGLPQMASLETIRKLLGDKQLKEHPEIRFFAIINETTGCVGFTIREWLDAALQGHTNSESSDGSNISDGSPIVSDDLPMTLSSAKKIGEADIALGDALIPIEHLSAGAPYMIASSMPAVRFYSMFVQGGVRMAAVVSPDGKYCGMITRSSLIASTRRYDPNADARSK